MVRNKEIVRRVTQLVINRNVTPRGAAELLEANVRTIYNYAKRYAAHGAVGLIDHRRGTYRKLTPESERQIVECKMMNFHRSACWIRKRLRLDISVESVRLVLIKHNLNGRAHHP